MGMTEQEKLEKVIKGLGSCVEYFACKVKGVMFDEWLEESRKAIALLKAQEQEAVDAPKPDSDIGCWYDITHNYALEQVVNALKAQEPMEPVYELGITRCGRCNREIDKYDGDNYCPQCGRAVKWE